MAKVRRSTPAPAPAARAPAAAVTKAKSSASAGAADTVAKSPAAAAVASPPVVIEIPSSPDPSSKGSSGCKKKARKRPAPPLDLDLDDEIEMWTPRQKQRRDEDCQILAGDPLSATTEVSPSPATANDEIAVVAERGKVRARPDSRTRALLRFFCFCGGAVERPRRRSEMCDHSDLVLKWLASHLKCVVFDVVLQVACRDYPHSRSACAKNPFDTTPHERHCDKVLARQACLPIG